MNDNARPRSGFSFLTLMAAVLALAAWTGCQTTSPSGARVAATTTVEGRSLTEIRMAALEVFQKAGYGVTSAHGRLLVFEKRGSLANDIAYGGWSQGVWVRVKLRIEELRPGCNALDCSVFWVENRGDAVLEDERTAYTQGKGPFKEMLAEVKKKLDALPPGEDGAAPK